MAKYRVYGNYVFSKILGEYEAASEEEAIQKALEEAEPNDFLCCDCSKEFVDSGELDEDSCTVDRIGADQMVHVSFDRVSEFVPRVPENRCPEEDNTIPRICVAPSIEDALNAMPRAGVVMDYMRQLGLPIILHVYHLEGGRVMLSEEVKQYVPDADLSHEMWLLDRPEKVYREDYEILNFETRAYTDMFGHEMRGIYGIRMQKCRFQSNTENFLNEYIGECRKEKIRGIIRENTFRVVLDNIGAEIIQKCRETDKEKNHVIQNQG